MTPISPSSSAPWRIDSGVLARNWAVPPDLIEHEVVDVFVAEASLDLACQLNPAEVKAVRWVDLDALALEIAAAPGQFTPWLAIYLAQHRAQIFGDIQALAG